MSSDYSDDDDQPLARSNGHLSAPTISKSEDKAMDRAGSSAKPLPAPVSIRHGPVTDADPMDVDKPQMNGSAKRKARPSIDQNGGPQDGPLGEGSRQAKRQKMADSDDSDDDVPLTSTRQKLPPKASRNDLFDESDSDDDVPLNAKLAQKRKSIEKAAVKDAKAKKPTPKKAIKDESDSDTPLASAKGKKRQSNGVTKTNGVKKEPDSDSDVPIRKKAKAPASTGRAKVKAEKPTPAKKATPKKTKKEESEEPAEDEEDEYKWWDAPKREDDSIKWDTLEHNGVLFPPPYEPLPKSVKLYYDGKPVSLDLEAEEVADFFGAMLHQPHNVENPVFQKNFFTDFKEILDRTGGAKDRQGNKIDIKEFAKLDFTKIFEYHQGLTEAKKARSKEEKKAEKEEKAKLEGPYLYCKLDGRKEKVGNFRVEPPGLFRGRGEHPKTGKVKLRVLPEQITINIGKDARVPPPPEGHKWKAVQHDNKATWLAMWQENVNGNYKYVMLAANSSLKGQSDLKKFEKARELKKHINRIRKDYTKELRHEMMANRQRATAMYLIDKFALRAGNEKDTENEAETVGCCSLKFEHITLNEPNTVVFDFLGKDSIRYYDEVQVDKQVFKNLKMFKKPPKTDGDDIFDRLTTSQLNKHLSSYMPGLTAKVFRTYNASYTMSKLLQSIPSEAMANMTVADKIYEYNKANREVAVLCNHKRTVAAGHEAQMEKLGDRIKGQKYELWRHKMMLLDVDTKQKKKKGAEYFEIDEELDAEWVVAHHTFLVEEERGKITKKFEKENEKRVASGEKPLPEKELKERLKQADAVEKRLKKEWKTKKVEAEGKSPTVEKLEDKIKKIEARIKTLETQAKDREGNKEVALGTSKINYIDPRLTVVFSKKFNVPIEKFFSKTLREKFNWAIQSVEDENWEF